MHKLDSHEVFLECLPSGFSLTLPFGGFAFSKKQSFRKASLTRAALKAFEYEKLYQRLCLMSQQFDLYGAQLQ